MKKEISIEGMTCQHCVKHVTHALEGIEGITNEELKAAIKEAGYEVTGIISHES